MKRKEGKKKVDSLMKASDRQREGGGKRKEKSPRDHNKKKEASIGLGFGRDLTYFRTPENRRPPLVATQKKEAHCVGACLAATRANATFARGTCEIEGAFPFVSRPWPQTAKVSGIRSLR